MISPEELFNLAEESQRGFDNNSAIHIFQQIITDFPETEYAYRALFMQAFIISEEPRNRDRAISLFEQLLEQYPVGDLNESAAFMLQLLKSGTPIEQLLGQ
jgi:outer membrane protein assembly factor BamD (BamD/ComL family)